MVRTAWIGLLAFTGLAASVVPARAEIVVHSPFFSIRFGRPGSPAFAVGLPGGFDVQVSRPASMMRAPPGGEPAPQPPEPVPPPAPIVSVPAPVQRIDTATVPLVPPGPPRPIRIEDFAASFQPGPGAYEVVFLHPRTERPVNVSFTLPAGCPKKVSVYRRELVFDYGRQEVRIRFLLGGRTKVLYD